VGDLERCRSNGVFKGMEKLLQNVQGHCELEVDEFVLQQAMLDDPFGMSGCRKVCALFMSVRQAGSTCPSACGGHWHRCIRAKHMWAFWNHGSRISVTSCARLERWLATVLLLTVMEETRLEVHGAIANMRC
jgi:hypothetical protein